MSLQESAHGAAAPLERGWSRPAGTLLLVIFAAAIVLFLDTARAVLRNEPGAGDPALTNQIGAPDSYTHWFALQAVRAGQTPYSDAVTEATQIAIWGQALGTQRQAFYYPLPVLLWYLPAAGLDLAGAAVYARALGLAGLAAGVALTLRLAHRPIGGRQGIAAAAALAAMIPAHDHFWLGQNTSVALTLALGAALLYRAERYGWAGLALALALIKPQNVLFLAAGLALHALASPRRWSFLVAAGGSLLGLLLASLLVVPGWVGQWLAVLRVHSSYDISYLRAVSGEQPVVQWLMAAALVGPLLFSWWQHRHTSTEGDWYPVVVAGGLVATMVALTPSTSFYNHVLLWPAFALILFTPAGLPAGFLGRFTTALNVLAFALPPVIGGSVAAAYHLAATEEAIVPLLRAGVTLVAAITFYQGLTAAGWLWEHLLPARLRRASLAHRPRTAPELARR